MTFQIKYNRSRFPERQKRDDGKWGCRGCGSEIPKGRTAWCSEECVKKFHPFYVIDAVKKRDKGICQTCGFDTAELVPNKWGGKERARRPEYDHVLSMADGGLTVLENMRTLCHPCHRERTKTWHGERADARRQQRSILDPAQTRQTQEMPS